MQPQKDLRDALLRIMTSNSNDKDYVHVYQTWCLVTREEKRDDKGELKNQQPVDIRKRVQHARIEKSMSIFDVASVLGYPADKLAAFERGDEVISSDVQRALLKLLNIK